ncbi:ligase-associated DNA damage response endonuclease PdeM [Mesorhizobium australicum]|uniref:Putative phosphoesterase n=1 Tax=Mesorhizobium australicum TaxID=536018 RepID=A0A1X7NKU8_9HYPH|nr:ligase-associated DNA damage response endonuclease PdeM [Mesorhizobium australicum]SMH38470.1 putative phosphoesterase [Mesorhizobium australicum]
MLARRHEAETFSAAAVIAGEEAVCDRRGALFFPAHGLLAVSDLHLEKGSAYARRGMMLPPYDTAETLTKLEAVIADFDPRIVVSLGDSFHDRVGSSLMPSIFRDRLERMMRCRDWLWVTGNHDPDAPDNLSGTSVTEVALGGLIFRHEPTAGQCAGEIAGHLHPGARIVRQGRSVRRPCFASDGLRMIMPAFGALTGSLNVLDRAYAGLFDWRAFRAHVLGSERVYALNRSVLFPG